MIGTVQIAQAASPCSAIERRRLARCVPGRNRAAARNWGVAAVVNHNVSFPSSRLRDGQIPSWPRAGSRAKPNRLDGDVRYTMYSGTKLAV